MPGLPSSQTKVHPVALQQAIEAAQARLPHLHLTLYGKVLKLRQMNSSDPLQQLQSDIISDMYDVVREMQVMLNPILLTLPNLPYTAG